MYALEQDESEAFPLGIHCGDSPLAIWVSWAARRWSWVPQSNSRTTNIGLPAALTPWALAYAAFVIVFYVLFLRSEPGEQGEPLPGVLRRIVAFWLDFALGMIAIVPIIGILPAMTEWKRTGTFVWNFEPSTPVPGDGLLVGIGVLLVFVGLVYFYAWPLMRLLPTPGSCIMGYRIVVDENGKLTTRSCLLRVLLGFIAACAWPIAPFIGRNKRKGKIWLDKVFKTRAVKLR